MILNNKLLGLLCVLALSCQGCSSSKHVRTQGNRFDLPETMTKSQYQLTVESAGVNEIRFTPDDLSLPPEIEQPELKAVSGQTGLRFSMGIFDKLELQVETLPYLSESLEGLPAAKAKYQFLGAPLRDAKKGNISLAVSAGMLYWEDSQTTNRNPSYVNDINILILDLAAIAGYRYTDTVLVYGGPFLTVLSFDGKWDRKSFGVAEGVGENYNGTGKQYGVNLGLSWFFSDQWSTQAELAYTDLTWNDAQDAFTHFGVQLSRLIR